MLVGTGFGGGIPGVGRRPELGKINIGGVDGEIVGIDIEEPLNGVGKDAALDVENQNEVPLKEGNGQPVYKEVDGAIIDENTGEQIVSPYMLRAFDKLGAGVFPRSNPQGNIGVPFAFDPRAFDLSRFKNSTEMTGAHSGALAHLNSNPFRDLQAKTIGDILSGQAPSQAQLQLARGRDSTLANMASLANSGGASPLLARQAMNNFGKTMSGFNLDSALLRSDEINNALTQAGAARTQDSQAQSLVNDIVKAMLTERLAAQGSAINLQKSQADELRQRYAAALGSSGQDKAMNSQILGALIGAAGTVGAAYGMSG